MRPLVCALLAGCSFDAGRATSDGRPQPDARADATPGTTVWDVGASDWAEGQFDEARPFAVGATDGIEPVTWAHGGLHLRGYQGATNAMNYAEFSALPPTGHGVAPMSAWQLGMPGGLGLTAPDNFAVWGDGEIHLPSGTYQVELQADDYGVMEIDGPNGLITLASATSASTTSISIPSAGWFPFRAAMRESTGSARLTVILVKNSQRTLITSDRLRVAAGAGTSLPNGLLRTSFDREPLLVRRGHEWFKDAQIAEDYGNDIPPGLGLTNATSYSQRVAGQFWLDDDDTVNFAYAMDDGFAIDVDGERLSTPSQWAQSEGLQQGTLTKTLTRGWHDVELHHVQRGGNARMQLVATTQAGQAVFVPGRMRPVEGIGRPYPFGRTLASGLPERIPFDNLRLAGPHYGIAVLIRSDDTQDSLDRTAATLVTPSGQEILLFSDDTVSNSEWIGVVPGTEIAAQPAVGNWAIRLDGDFVATEVFMTFVAGGDPALPSEASWTSPVHDFGSAIAIDRTEWQGGAPPGSDVRLTVRTCFDASCQEASAWQEVHGEPLMPSRYAQVRVMMTSDGRGMPWVDFLRIEGR